MALVWIGAIYSTLYVARPAAEFLRERNLLRLTVWTVVGLLAVAVVAWALRVRPGLRGWGALALGAAAFLLGISSVSPPEVKLHFVQYGILGGLFYLALKLRTRRWAALLALLLTGLAGWLDEGIQYLLPNRWYGLEDVAINTVAGGMAIATMVLFGWARRAEAGSP
jgi:hypothetical protein